MQTKNQLAHRRELLYQRMWAFMVDAFGFDMQMVEKYDRKTKISKCKDKKTSKSL